MEKDLKFYRKVARELREKMGDHTEATAVRIIADETGVDILPAKTNTRGTFYHTEELVDYCRYKGLSNWVSVYEGKTKAHVY